METVYKLTINIIPSRLPLLIMWWQAKRKTNYMEKEQEIKLALHLLNRHDHIGLGRTEERENCGACVLNGYGEKKNGEPIAPNYSGWARIYVQAGKTIPAKYWNGFQKELSSANKLYVKALMEDCKHYGLKLEKE